MRNNFTVFLALAAGFIGGSASRFWSPAPAYAQKQPLPTTEIRAQKFVLVDRNGAARGVFGFEANGSPVLEISSETGRVFTTRWYGGFHEPPAPGKITLLP